MARPRKSRPRPNAARKRPGPKRARKAADASSRQAAPSHPLEDFVKTFAHELALPIKPQWLAAVAANLEVNLRMAALVAEFPLPDESEPAPVFSA
jgi:hypothetical protein